MPVLPTSPSLRRVRLTKTRSRQPTETIWLERNCLSFRNQLAKDLTVDDLDSMGRSKRAFNVLFALTPIERAAYDKLMHRTGHRPVTMWKLGQEGKLSKDEMTAAGKQRKVGIAFYMNHGSAESVTNDDNLTEMEVIAVKKLGELVEQRFQQLFFMFFSC